MVSVLLIIDAITIVRNYKIAVEKKIKYEKKLGMEMFLLFVWSLCLSCIIVIN